MHILNRALSSRRFGWRTRLAAHWRLYGGDYFAVIFILIFTLLFLRVTYS